MRIDSVFTSMKPYISSVVSRLSLLVWLIGFISVHSQTLQYSVELLGINTGDMVLKKYTDANGRLRFSMNTSADVNYFFGRTTASFSSDIRYQQGKIIYAQAKNIRDGKTGRFSYLKCSSGGCDVETNRGKSKIGVPPSWCIARLFFEEPLHQTQVYSEDWGQMLPLKKIGPGRYQVEIPSDKPNEYKYEGGRMVELITHTSIGKARVLLKQ